MRLYHFTCSHATPRIRAAGELFPWPQIQLDGRALVWLTDLEAPTREQVGLTSKTLRCDRMECRFEVDCDPVRWTDYARGLPREVRRLAADLSATDGALPAHWWVSEVPVPVLGGDAA